MSKKVVIGLIGVVALIALWFGVYTLRSKQIDAEVASMQQADNYSEVSTDDLEVGEVTVIANDTEYTLDEFAVFYTNLDDSDKSAYEIVDVNIQYVGTENVTETKQAYITYSDVDSVQYVDNAYGRILIPNVD
jgi:uncharacterized protein YxeA